MEASIDRKICFKLFTVPGELISHISSHTIIISIIILVVFVLFLFLRAAVAAGWLLSLLIVVQRSPFI